MNEPRRGIKVYELKGTPRSSVPDDDEVTAGFVIESIIGAVGIFAMLYAWYWVAYLWPATAK